MPVVNPNAVNTLNAATNPEGVIGFVPLTQPLVVAQSGIPLYMPGNGTLTAAGALTLTGTALDQTFANAYFFFPANAVSTSSVAGMYFVKMTSTTAGTVFRNQYTGGTPTIPGTSALIPCTTASSYTQTTAAFVLLASATIPANAMGVNGQVKTAGLYQNNNSAGAKTHRILFGGLSGTTTFSLAQTTNQSMVVLRDISNRGLVSTQSTGPAGSTGVSVNSSPSIVMSFDTTADQDVVYAAQLATATDWVGLDYFRVEVSPQ